MITFGELSTRWAGVVISIVLVLVVLIAILFVMSVAEKLSRKSALRLKADMLRGKAAAEEYHSVKASKALINIINRRYYLFSDFI